VDYSRPQRAVPALMAFVLIPFTSSISVGASFSFVVLFPLFVLTPNIVKLRPQIVCAFALAVLLLVVETKLVQDSVTMGAVLGGLLVFVLAASFPLYYCHDNLLERFGDSEYDPSSFPHNKVSVGGGSNSKSATRSMRNKLKAATAPSSVIVADDSRLVESGVGSVRDPAWEKFQGWGLTLSTPSGRIPSRSYFIALAGQVLPSKPAPKGADEFGW
jgi:hypothetical protein